MSSEKSLTPQIRFKGFTEAWEQRKLGDIAAFSKGQGFSKSNLTDSGFPVILYGRLYTNYETQICKVDTFVKNSSCGVLSKGGEVIVPASGETAEDIAVASHVSLPGILLGGDLNVVTPKDNLDSNFLALFITFGNAHVELSKRAQGKSVVHVRNGDLSQLNIKYPTQSEQILISNLFIKNDNLITLHQRKLDAIKKIKSALLEKMFPKDGSDIPEIRFTGFTEAWEQRKLGKLLEINDAKNINLIDSSKTISVSSMSWNPAGNGASANSLGSYKVLNYGEMAFEGNRTKGHPYGKLVINDIGTGIMSSRFRTLKPTSFICVPFWKFYLSNKTIFTPIFLNSTKRGTLMNELVVSDLLKQSVMLPITDEEQIRIGTLFVSINNLITLHQRKLDALKKIKSALLEKMFV